VQHSISLRRAFLFFMAAMRLLVTNDDGIDSVFLHELVGALRAAGHQLAVVAPAREQSWIGAAKSRHRPIAAEPAERGIGCPTWIVDGTPSDCVNIAFGHLLPRTPTGLAAVESGGEPVEAVVSGINTGSNSSISFILASGTIGGAWEGAVHGLPAVAFSQNLTLATYATLKDGGGLPGAEVLAVARISANHAARLLPALVAGTPPHGFIVHNVNFPAGCRPDSEVRRTVPARVVMGSLFAPRGEDAMHRFEFRPGEDISPGGALTDRAALSAGYISHTVLDYTKLGS
jgi:5'-nucleotidase